MYTPHQYEIIKQRLMAKYGKPKGSQDAKDLGFLFWYAEYHCDQVEGLAGQRDALRAGLEALKAGDTR